jgi:transcriptional regulator with XRE-family HTH domain
MAAEDRTGARVAEVRNLRGWTQRKLATQAHVSYSLVTKVEQGVVPASPAFIGAVARALRVDVTRITGQPYIGPRDRDGSALADTVVAIRRAIEAYDLPPEGVPPRAVRELAADVAHLSDLGRAANYSRIGQILPDLLESLSVAAHSVPKHERRYVMALLAEAYSGATAIAALLGFLDLRDRAVDRIERASQESGDRLRVARVQWQRGQSMLHHGAYDEGLRLMDRTRREVGEDEHADAPTMSLLGSTHLRSAVLAARAGGQAHADGDDLGKEAYAQRAWAHIDAAAEVADHLGGDRDDYGLAFGPSNVQQHGVAVAVELEEGAEAVRRARQARIARTVPAVRRGHHYIDLARGYLMAGDHGGALRCLRTARRIAPQQTRHHPLVRETVRGIAENGRANTELASFAGWIGIEL